MITRTVCPSHAHLSGCSFLTLCLTTHTPSIWGPESCHSWQPCCVSTQWALSSPQQLCWRVWFGMSWEARAEAPEPRTPPPVAQACLTLPILSCDHTACALAASLWGPIGLSFCLHQAQKPKSLRKVLCSSLELRTHIRYSISMSWDWNRHTYPVGHTHPFVIQSHRKESSFPSQDIIQHPGN